MAIYGIFEKQLGKTMQKHKENFKITIAVRDIDKNVFCTTFSGHTVGKVCREKPGDRGLNLFFKEGWQKKRQLVLHFKTTTSTGQQVVSRIAQEARIENTK